MPLNVQMRNAVVAHADLLDDSGDTGMPQCLRDLCAHVAGHEIVMERWRSERFEPLDPDDNRSVIRYPAPALADYVVPSYSRLKAKQSELLRPRSIRSRIINKIRQARQITEEPAAQPPSESRS
jgi:hypothetical protein